MIAAIDVGTNTIKMAVGTIDPDGSMRIVADESVIARIGEGVDKSGEISDSALDRSIDVVKKLIDMARSYSVDNIRIVGTSALRDAANREDVVRRFTDTLDVELEVLSESDECRLSYLAVAHDPILGDFNGSQLTFDIGGGSTELTFGSVHEISWGKSVKIGAVRLTERFINSDPPTNAELQAVAAFADEAIRGVVGNLRVSRAVGIGGSIINIARVWRGVPAGRTEDVHGIEMRLSDVECVRSRMAAMSLNERKRVVGLDTDRADIIVAGAIIVERILRMIATDVVRVSICGLRHGVLREMLGTGGLGS